MGVVPGEYTAIEFTDTGAGMSPAVAARIFEPFYSTKERDKGTGLGLSMVFGFVKQSGGHISVYSEVGVGSTFRLYFPRNLESTDAGNARSERIEALPKGVGETVLTVEDNTALRRIVVRQLNELGYQVLQANDAVEALRLLESGGVDLLLTDIVMPGKMDGYELAIAALAQCPTLKIVLTSGFPEARQREGLVPLDLPFLPKPFRKDELASLLRDVLAA
jgi:CheY-like chemotaxis protein